MTEVVGKIQNSFYFTNTTTNFTGDHEMTCYGTSGFVIIEFKKDEYYTSFKGKNNGIYIKINI